MWGLIFGKLLGAIFLPISYVDFQFSSPSLTKITSFRNRCFDRNRKLLSPSAKRFRRSGEGSWITKASRTLWLYPYPSIGVREISGLISHPHRRSISLAVPQLQINNDMFIFTYFYWWVRGSLFIHFLSPRKILGTEPMPPNLTRSSVIDQGRRHSLFERNEITFPDIMSLYLC